MATPNPAPNRRDPAPTSGPGGSTTVDLGPFELEAGGPALPLTLAYRHDGPGPGRAAGARRPRAHRLGRRGRRLVGRRSSARASPSTPTRSASCAPTCSAAATARPGRPSIDPRPAGRGAVASPRSRRATRPGPCGAWPTRSGIERLAVVTGGSLGGMIALEVALERPDRVDHVVPIAAPAATGPMAIAWNHIQLELHRPARRRGPRARPPARDDHLSLARPTSTAGSGARLRAGRPVLDQLLPRPPGRQAASTASTATPTGRWSGSMDGHDVGRGPGRDRDGVRGAGCRRDVGLTGARHPGRHPLRAGAGPGGSSPRRARPACDGAIPRAALDQGPRRVPHRVGPADPDPRRRAGGREAPARPTAAARGRRGGGGRSGLIDSGTFHSTGGLLRLYRGRQARQPGEGPWTGTS